MRKQYLFSLAAIVLAAGLVFTACDLLEVDDGVVPDTSGLSFTKDLDNQNQSLITGQSAAIALTVTAKNKAGGTISYQWYCGEEDEYTGEKISGATKNTYTLPMNEPGTFYYYATASNNTGGTIKSKIAKVVVNTNEIIVGGSSGIPITDLKETIASLLKTDPTVPYNVTFAEDLETPMLISQDVFGGTGRLTVKAIKTLTWGIHVTRSNTELNGIKMDISNIDNVPLYEAGERCAVLISKRYGAYYTYPGNAVYTNDVKNYTKYVSFDTNTIKNVAVVNCNIKFEAESSAKTMLGICVDPYTVGRKEADRVKITNNIVYVNNSSSEKASKAFGTSKAGRCFMGDNADLSGNKFTSTKDVLDIEFLFPITYAIAPKIPSSTITFKNNQFITTNSYDKFDNLVALITVNAGPTDDKLGFKEHQKLISSEVESFGTTTHKFTELKEYQQALVKDLFTQIPDDVNKRIRLHDQSTDSNDYLETDGSFKTTGTYSVAFYTRTESGILAEAPEWAPTPTTP